MFFPSPRRRVFERRATVKRVIGATNGSRPLSWYFLTSGARNVPSLGRGVCRKCVIVCDSFDRPKKKKLSFLRKCDRWIDVTNDSNEHFYRRTQITKDHKHGYTNDNVILERDSFFKPSIYPYLRLPLSYLNILEYRQQDSHYASLHCLQTRKIEVPRCVKVSSVV